MPMRKFIYVLILILPAIILIACSNTTNINTQFTEPAGNEITESNTTETATTTVAEVNTEPPTSTITEENTETATSTVTEENTETESTTILTTEPETIPPTEPETTPPATEVATEPPTSIPVKGNYLVKVNVVHNCVTIYEKDSTGEYNVPVKAFVCSTGREGHETPLGTFTTSAKWDWAVMGDGTYTQYVYRFNGPYLFHSVPYFTQAYDDLEYEEFNKLGEAASAGCIRLCARDAKWIYDNVGVGSTVIIYKDETTPGPLGKPEILKIPLDSPYKSWDPTDPNPNNPWHTS